MIQPTYKEFCRLARQGNLIPVYQELLMDLETPLSFFKRLERDRYSFLLESVEGSERWARYSFLGTSPHRVFKSRGNQVEIVENGKLKKLVSEVPLDLLQELLKDCRPVTVPGVPPFFGGALGYVSYNAVEQFHEITNSKQDPLGMPEIFFVFVQTLVAFDNLKHTIKVIDNVEIKEKINLRRAYDASVKRIRKVIASLQKKPRGIEPRDLNQSNGNRKFRSNLTQQGFENAVTRAKEYIKAGDVIQVVLCQRLETETSSDPFEIYRALRFINPSPYMFYLELEDLRVIGSSPETMVRLTGNTIELRPIAGTRRRGATPEEERALEDDLLADPKERAEHIMLVDLGRNDVGRVAEIGTVEVNELMAIERYSHVIHIVSNVRGKLATDKSAFDLFVSAFPAGTVSGAPKIRAMQIISELEPQKRGLYAGAIGYFGYNGNLDTCIVIRTILMKGKKVFITAGAGIVADSDPQLEYQETLNKARAMLKAVDLAEQWRKR
ncbi:MAG: anthranilate synthase component I [Deltaproteobacteria bacterium]|jgi:anthranilate synthase component 1|nr:MAG: anthranilate synthase component I [Deltaproteobacteria bacterium]